MLEEELKSVAFDHLSAPWVLPSWHGKIVRVPAPAECRIWGRPWPVGGDCCLWTGANDGKPNGRVHGVVKIKGRKIYIHRHALASHLGVDIATLDNVDHICRNSTCFNPYHLEDIDGVENTRRGDGVLTQFKRQEEYGESTVSDDDVAALASGHNWSSRR